MNSESTTKIVIVGAGPSGLLLAYKLMQSISSQRYDITLLEQRPEFRTYTAEQSRTFPIALQNRGWNALPTVVQDTLSSQGVWTDGVCLHGKRGKPPRIIPREKKNLSIDRNRVTLTLLEALTKLKDQGDSKHSLTICFDSTVESMDFAKREIEVVQITKQTVRKTLSYDFLVAADGGNSKYQGEDDWGGINQGRQNIIGRHIAILS